MSSFGNIWNALFSWKFNWVKILETDLFNKLNTVFVFCTVSVIAVVILTLSHSFQNFKKTSASTWTKHTCTINKRSEKGKNSHGVQLSTLQCVCQQFHAVMPLLCCYTQQSSLLGLLSFLKAFPSPWTISLGINLSITPWSCTAKAQVPINI